MARQAEIEAEKNHLLYLNVRDILCAITGSKEATVRQRFKCNSSCLTHGQKI